MGTSTAGIFEGPGMPIPTDRRACRGLAGVSQRLAVKLQALSLFLSLYSEHRIPMLKTITVLPVLDVPLLKLRPTILSDRVSAEDSRSVSGEVRRSRSLICEKQVRYRSVLTASVRL